MPSRTEWLALAAGTALALLGCDASHDSSRTPGSGATGGGGAAGGGGAMAGSGGGIDAGSDAPSGGSVPYVPEPIPDIDPEPPPPCPEQTPVGYFQFLDDTCGAKQHPSAQNRQQLCETYDESAEIPLRGGGVAVYRPSSEPVVVEADALTSLVPAGMEVTVILIRRVGGVPHYRYLSSGAHDVALQPWSTTKFLAAANAAVTLRVESGYEVGLTAEVDGIELGDLITSIHNYDHDPYSSNALGAYFHNIGGRSQANAMIHEYWLQRPAGESFGGNYGQAAPALGYSFVEDCGPTVDIAPDGSSGYDNHLSTFTLAEALKRLVLHREEADQRLPGIQWADIETLLYGAAVGESTQYGPWGGMSADTAIYLQTGHDIDYLESRSKGRWTIFSKLGLGSGGQFMNVGYACLPVLDDQLQPVAGWGREIVIAAHLDSGGATWADRDRLLAKTYRAIITRIVDGSL